MITKDQVLTVSEKIIERYHTLAKGNTIEIRSSEFNDMSIDEQRVTLDYLANDKGLILYEWTPVFSSFDDIPPNELGDMYEVALMADVPSETIINDALEQGVYTISVLKEFVPTALEERYRLTYVDHTLKLNGIVLAKPIFLKENDSFLSFIFNDGGKSKVFRISELEKTMGTGERLKKKPHQILDDLGVKGEIKKMFFPNISSAGIEFVNPISAKYLEENNLQDLSANELIDSSKK